MQGARSTLVVLRQPIAGTHWIQNKISVNNAVMCGGLLGVKQPATTVLFASPTASPTRPRQRSRLFINSSTLSSRLLSDEGILKEPGKPGKPNLQPTHSDLPLGAVVIASAPHGNVLHDSWFHSSVLPAGRARVDMRFLLDSRLAGMRWYEFSTHVHTFGLQLEALALAFLLRV